MNTKTRISERFSLSNGDFLRGLLIAVLSAIFPIVTEVLNTGSLNLDWKIILTTGLSAGLGYLSKNLLFEPPKVITVTEDNKTAKQASEVIKQATE